MYLEVGIKNAAGGTVVARAVLRQMGADVLGHAEAAHLLCAEDLRHLLVGDEVLLVVGILKRASRSRT